jgi:hypothetical protein
MGRLRRIASIFAVQDLKVLEFWFPVRQAESTLGSLVVGRRLILFTCRAGHDGDV